MFWLTVVETQTHESDVEPTSGASDGGWTGAGPDGVLVWTGVGGCWMNRAGIFYKDREAAVDG